MVNNLSAQRERRETTTSDDVLRPVAVAGDDNSSTAHNISFKNGSRRIMRRRNHAPASSVHGVLECRGGIMAVRCRHGMRQAATDERREKREIDPRLCAGPKPRRERALASSTRERGRLSRCFPAIDKPRNHAGRPIVSRGHETPALIAFSSVGTRRVVSLAS